MVVVEALFVLVFVVAAASLSTYALVDWWRRKQAATPYPVREVPRMLSMMEMEDGAFVLTLREGPTTHIDDAFDGVKLIYTGGYLKEIRARRLADLGAFLRENGGFYEAPVLLDEIAPPRSPATRPRPRPPRRHPPPPTLPAP